MALKKLFDKKMPPDCVYCARGTAIGEGEIACLKKGVSHEGSSCRKFTYDPLKRDPEFRRDMPKQEYIPEDFKL